MTGYEGKERIYVKDMIKVIGAVYSGELSQVSTQGFRLAQCFKTLLCKVVLFMYGSIVHVR